VQWQILRLTEKTGGSAYGATARPVEERIKALFPQITNTSRPTVVWFQDLEDEKAITRVDGSIFQNENVGLSMKRFNCFKLDVHGIPDGRLKEKYLKQIGFHFFDPKGELIGKPLVGKRSTSLSGFTSAVEKAWSKVFTMRLKTYQKKMKHILDGFDKVDSKKQVLDKQLERLAKKPNPAKKRQIDKEMAVLNEMKKKVEEEEKGIMEECALKPEYLPKTTDAE
jgi:hypothetical protein